MIFHNNIAEKYSYNFHLEEFCLEAHNQAVYRNILIAVGTRCEEGGEQVEGCPATVSGLSSSTLLVVLPVVCSFQLVIITALALAFYRYYLSILDTGTTKGSRKKCYFYSGFKKVLFSSPPPLSFSLSKRAIKKRFFCGFPNYY